MTGDPSKAPPNASVMPYAGGDPAAATEDPSGEFFAKVDEYVGAGGPILGGDVFDWVLTHGRATLRGLALFDELCWRMVGKGLPLWRATFSTPTLHPQFLGYNYRWWRDRGIAEEYQVLRGIDQTLDYRESPIRSVMERGEPVRYRLAQPEAEAAIAAFPMLGRLRDAGATDYFACPLTSFNGRFQTTTWTTDRASGFEAGEIALIERLLPALAAVADAKVMQRIAGTLLDVYLGRTVGQRVLDGEIRRGYGERLRAVLMATDLRGFTALSDRLPGEELIELLDDYFEAVTQPVQSEGGEVLKFIGDGVLAIFAVGEGSEADSTAAALRAARSSLHRLDELNLRRIAAGRGTLRVGIGLHLGEVFYGNVGATDRLDFTAIGPAVNLTSRLEGLTKRLDRPLLVSDDFARACKQPLISLGFHPVRGFSEPAEIFGLPEG
ncbi:MAG TPA: adenylate/guanylate cyclase domain-containing protein [Stellaceae bacterium]|nr:adenylate/guanylate cyclase domain-containing protein [Stellaceae bacterium]